jgi:hypothetical protein
MKPGDLGGHGLGLDGSPFATVMLIVLGLLDKRSSTRQTGKHMENTESNLVTMHRLGRIKNTLQGNSEAVRNFIAPCINA